MSANYTFKETKGPVWTTKNHHSISVTQFPSLITHHSYFITHHSSLKFSHPFAFIIQFLSLNIFDTIHGPHNCHCVSLFCFVTRVPFFPSVFLFSHFLFPLQPCLSPKAETQTQKNVSTSLAKSVPSSPVNNAEVSDVYSGAISPSWPTSPSGAEEETQTQNLLRHDPFPSGAGEQQHQRHPFADFVTDQFLRPKAVLPSLIQLSSGIPPSWPISAFIYVCRWKGLFSYFVDLLVGTIPSVAVSSKLGFQIWPLPLSVCLSYSSLSPFLSLVPPSVCLHRISVETETGLW